MSQETVKQSCSILSVNLNPIKIATKYQKGTLAIFQYLRILDLTNSSKANFSIPSTQPSYIKATLILTGESPRISLKYQEPIFPIAFKIRNSNSKILKSKKLD